MALIPAVIVRETSFLQVSTFEGFLGEGLDQLLGGNGRFLGGLDGLIQETPFADLDAGRFGVCASCSRCSLVTFLSLPNRGLDTKVLGELLSFCFSS